MGKRRFSAQLGAYPWNLMRTSSGCIGDVGDVGSADGLFLDRLDGGGGGVVSGLHVRRGECAGRVKETAHHRVVL